MSRLPDRSPAGLPDSPPGRNRPVRGRVEAIEWVSLVAALAPFDDTPQLATDTLIDLRSLRWPALEAVAAGLDVADLHYRRALPFQGAGRVVPPPCWKQNMVILFALYPLVFMLNEWLQKPILFGIFGLPYWAFLFVNNAVSVVMLSLILPRVSR